MTIQTYMNVPFRVESPVNGLTVVHVAPGATVPKHSHAEGYVVVPFWPASVERVTHQNDQVIKREPLTLLPLVPYYVEATRAGQTISLKNTGTGVSAFQKMVPEPPITGPQPELITEEFTIVSQGNRRNVFTVEIAVTLIEQAVGLMFRPRVAPDRGMLFVWFGPREVAMYMRNVLVPLDFLFIDESLTITYIHQNAAPGDLTPIHSQGKVILTLEVPGGTVARLGIATGDTVF
jgi:uncharacterized membrane protein (UPF0127 family)